MERRSSLAAVLLYLVLALTLIGNGFGDDESSHSTGRTDGSDSFSGDGDVAGVHSGILGSHPIEEEKENGGGGELSRNETATATPDSTQTQEKEEDEEDLTGSEAQTTPPPKVAVAKEDEEKTNGQETDSQTVVDSSNQTDPDSDGRRSDGDGGGEEVTSQDPSRKVIIWDGSVDVGTVDPDQVSAEVNDPKQPPSQERHSDVDLDKEESKKKGGSAGGGGGEKSRNTNDGRSDVGNNSAPSSSSSIWLILFAVFGSAVFLSVTKTDLESTIERNSCCSCSESQSNRSDEFIGREQPTTSLHSPINANNRKNSSKQLGRGLTKTTLKTL